MTPSPSRFERMIFTGRGLLLALFALISLAMIFGISQLHLDTGLARMVPQNHEYIRNLLRYKDELGLGNEVHIVLALKPGVSGDIFNPRYMQTLKQLSDSVANLPGVDKSKMKSLWTPNVRWIDVTKDGFVGGEVIPNSYDGGAASLDKLKRNVLRSGQVGMLVADDFRSTMINAPLIEGLFNYRDISHQLDALQQQFGQGPYEVHINGVAKIIGDLIDGGRQIAVFFLVAMGLTFLLLLWDFGDIVSALTVIFCALITVVWQQGVMGLLGVFGVHGFGLDPYSMLVPFLVFAIAVSHSVQVVNMVAVQYTEGDADPETAARHAFRSLIKAGTLGLAMEALGFLTLLMIRIQVIQSLAISASIGVALILLTSFVLLPILMSYFRISPRAIARARAKSNATGIWGLLAHMTRRPMAVTAILLAVLMLLAAVVEGRGLKIGDLDRGAPELKADSRYNKDDAYISQHYSISADVLVVMVKTPAQQCTSFATLETIDRLQWYLDDIPGVQSAKSLVTGTKRVLVGFNESNPRWSTIVSDDHVLNDATSQLTDLYSADCDLVPVFVFLNDHKAETLQRVTDAIKSFRLQYNRPDVQILLASGNAGIEAASNDVIAASKNPMLGLVYAVVIVLSFIAFRSWRPVVCIVLPLVVTSMLCEALMTFLGIGVKVATLPVIALGVGIGVDYGIYIYARLESYLQQGLPLDEAYEATVASTGRAVSFTGMTLAIGVLTWVFSPIKFQADMGILLTFMFLWNMVGALVLLPALAHFLVPRTHKPSA